MREKNDSGNSGGTENGRISLRFRPEYRVLDNSACHSTDKKKKDWLAKLYFKEKICFLLTHDYPLDEKMDIISDEYDYIIKNAYYAGEKKVRATKTFKVGKRIKDMVRIIKRK